MSHYPFRVPNDTLFSVIKPQLFWMHCYEFKLSAMYLWQGKIYHPIDIRCKINSSSFYITISPGVLPHIAENYNPYFFIKNYAVKTHKTFKNI